MIMTLATAPDGAPFTTRAEAIVSREPPFAWSPQLQAFTVHLSNGRTVIVRDSAANRDAVQRALAGASADVSPPAPPTILVVQKEEK